MLKSVLEFLWVTFPVYAMFFVLVAFWWPREGMPWGRIAVMSFVSGLLMMLYAACAPDVFNKIQAMGMPTSIVEVG